MQLFLIVANDKIFNFFLLYRNLHSCINVTISLVSVDKILNIFQKIPELFLLRLKATKCDNVKSINYWIKQKIILLSFNKD